MSSFHRFYDSRDVLRASVRLFDAKAKCAEVFLLICEEFGIGICVTYSLVQRRGPWVLARPESFVDARAERSEGSASRGEAEKGREREEEKKKEEGEEDEGFVEKAFRVGVARWASRLPRRECG